ncbi:MAG: presenilin family intramembrane aspartyl protease [archaeon]
MKHSWLVTFALLATFLAAQFFGLFLITKEANVQTVNGTITVQYGDTALGERPKTEGSQSFLLVVIGVGIGTILLLLLMKFNKIGIWKFWFFLAVWFAITVTLGVFFPAFIALLIAAALAAWKLWKPNLIIHNLTEIFMYGGIALLFVPLFNVLWALLLLLAVSLYDAYAVWKSKHMVKMAQFQTKSNLFAGLYFPYKQKEHASKHAVHASTHHATPLLPGKHKHAILGGGDIAFPLLFAGTALTQLFSTGMTKSAAFLHTTPVVLGAALALGLLFYFAKKDKFYPAMPFLTIGCLVGYAVMFLM